MKRKSFKLLLVLLLVALTVSTLVACGGINISITFMVEGEEYDTVDVNVTSVVTMTFPSNPTKTDYTFDGWYWDDGTWQQPFTTNSILDKPISENMNFNVYAKFKRSSPYSVIFKKGTDTYHTLDTLGMEAITLPTEPTRYGYKFNGWETADGEPFDENSLLNVELDADMEVYAKWIEKYTITYVTSEGVTHTNQTSYLDGETIQLQNPIYSDGSRGKWLDEDGEIVESLPINGEYRDVTLTASKISVVRIGVTNAGYGIEWLKKTINEFNAMQDEYIVEIFDESPNFDSKGEQQLKDPSTAENDLYIISEVWWKNNAKNLYFEPLDEVYNAPFNDEMTIAEAMRAENIAEALVEDKNGEEHYYAINYASTASGLIYNKTIGDYYESLPAWGNTVKMATIKNGGTVDQLVTWMEKIEELSKTYYDFGSNGKYLDGATTINTQGGTVPAVYPMVYAGMHSYWDAVLNTWWAQAAGITGYRSFFEYASPAVYADQARLRALKALEKLDVNENSVPGSVSMDHIVSQNEFLRGRAALIPCGDWMYYESKQNAINWNVDFEMIYVPACDNDVPQSNRKIIQYSDGGLAVIPSGDKNPNTNVEGAKAFLKYLFSERGCLNFTMETGAMWGFDGTEDPNTTYATAVANGDVGLGMSTYNYGVYNLVMNANGIVTKLPNNPDAPNAAFASTSGVGGEWPSLDMSRIREGSMTAQEAFQQCINCVGAETANHDSNSEWDRWWNIVHTVA